MTDLATSWIFMYLFEPAAHDGLLENPLQTCHSELVSEPLTFEILKKVQDDRLQIQDDRLQVQNDMLGDILTPMTPFIIGEHSFTVKVKSSFIAMNRFITVICQHARQSSPAGDSLPLSQTRTHRIRRSCGSYRHDAGRGSKPP